MKNRSICVVEHTISTRGFLGVSRFRRVWFILCACWRAIRPATLMSFSFRSRYSRCLCSANTSAKAMAPVGVCMWCIVGMVCGGGG